MCFRFNISIIHSVTAIIVGLCSILAIDIALAQPTDQDVSRQEVPAGKVRVAAIQAQGHTIDWKLDNTADTLAAVDRNLAALEQLVVRAGESKCRVVALPEDSLGLLAWLGPNEDLAREVLTRAVPRMIKRLGATAARFGMYLIVCSDYFESDGGLYNTAFLLGPDGKEIGRYHKVCPAWHEAGARRRGTEFPVFQTKHIGDVGMLICYDLVIPETARAIALQGADIIFFPTMGGAAVGDGDIGMQALRVRAAENSVWLVVAQRGSGAMIISPRGTIVARAEGVDGMAIADIELAGGRRGGDALSEVEDMRGRLFRERNPAAFGILTSPIPPILDKVPIAMSAEETARISSLVLSQGEEEFSAAQQLIKQGKLDEARIAFLAMRSRYTGSWIDRESKKQLAFIAAGNGPEEAQPSVHFSIDAKANSADPDQRRTYELMVHAPWVDGGSVALNLPEHLEYMPGTRGIARHHDARDNVWRISDDGKAAFFEVESLSEPGITLSATATAHADEARLAFTITNRSDKTLEQLRPLFCFNYLGLSKFPKQNQENFSHTFVVATGQPTLLSALPVENASATARMAQIVSCTDQHNWWAEEMGGLSPTQLDLGLTIVTDKMGDRKLGVHWSPGKNLLSNARIPCIHADPCMGDLSPGASVTVHGSTYFTRESIEDLVERVRTIERARQSPAPTPETAPTH